MIQKLRSTVDRIELRQNEEQKDDKIGSVMKEIELIRNTLNALVEKKNENPKAGKLRAWIANKVGLPQYFDVLIRAKWD